MCPIWKKSLPVLSVPLELQQDGALSHRTSITVAVLWPPHTGIFNGTELLENFSAYHYLSNDTVRKIYTKWCCINHDRWFCGNETWDPTYGSPPTWGIRPTLPVWVRSSHLTPTNFHHVRKLQTTENAWGIFKVFPHSRKLSNPSKHRF